MGAYAPVSGKYGAIIVGGTTTYLGEWSINGNAANVDTTGFNAPTDASNIVYSTGLTSIVDAEVTLRGRYDRGNNPWGLGLIAGVQSVTVFLGLAPGFGVTVNCRVLSCQAGQQARDAGTFEARLQVNGIVAWPKSG